MTDNRIRFVITSPESKSLYDLTAQAVDLDENYERCADLPRDDFIARLARGYTNRR